MDAEKFEQKFRSKVYNKSIHMSTEGYIESQKKFIEHSMEVNEDENLVIPMEEMAELTQHLSKVLRGKEPYYDNYPLIEELADVQICIDRLKLYLDISDDDLKYAMEVKIENSLDKLEKGLM